LRHCANGKAARGAHPSCAILARRTSGLRPRQRAVARQRRLELEHVAWTTDDDLAASGLDDDAV
jgi:hypothetical protein